MKQQKPEHFNEIEMLLSIDGGNRNLLDLYQKNQESFTDYIQYMVKRIRRDGMKIRRLANIIARANKSTTPKI